MRLRIHKYLLIGLLIVLSLIGGGLIGYYGDFSWLYPPEEPVPAMASVEIDGNLEIDLSQEGTRTEQLKNIYLADTNPKVIKTFQQLIDQQVKTAHFQTVLNDPSIPLPIGNMEVSMKKSSFDAIRKRIVVPYSLKGYIVAPEDSLLNSIPDIADEGSSFTDVFIVPADPTKLFQRLGYSCANQNGLPLGKVDDKNYGDYFDPKCAPGVKLCLNSAGKQSTESCLNVLQKENGAASLTVHYKRVAYNADLAEKWQLDKEPVSKGVDFVADKEELENYDIVYKKFDPNSCAIQEACVNGPGVRRLLRFDAAGKNIGDTDLSFGATADMQKTNQFSYNACHKHQHMVGYAQYSLGETGRAPLAGAKQTFCIQGTDRSRNDSKTSFNSDFDCSDQGIKAGWEDEYFIGLDCQWIDITDLPIKGDSEQMQLSMEVNPLKLICEGKPNPGKLVPAFDDKGNPILNHGKPIQKQACQVDPAYYKNNKATVTVTIPKTGSSINLACGTIDYGFKRNCDWNMNEVKTCTAGQAVNVINTKNDLLRVCPDGFSCSYDDALVSTDARTAQFTCPAEGKYLIMTATYVAK